VRSEASTDGKRAAHGGAGPSVTRPARSSASAQSQHAAQMDGRDTEGRRQRLSAALGDLADESRTEYTELTRRTREPFLGTSSAAERDPSGSRLSRRALP